MQHSSWWNRNGIWIVSAALAAALMVLTWLNFAFGASACGVWRHDVKTVSDAQGVSVLLSAAVPSTVEDLRALAVPGPLTKDTPRFNAERRRYMVTATALRSKQEADQDFHVVIAGETGKTMIVEFVSPLCAGPTVKQQITRARADFVRLYGQPGTSRFKAIPTSPPAIFTGVLFFDELHGQSGVAPNGVELHPVLMVTR